MALRGNIEMEDITVTYRQGVEDLTVDYEVRDSFNGDVEYFHGVPQSKFFAALAIAVHNDGMPNAEKDYPDAESIMGGIRWIP